MKINRKRLEEILNLEKEVKEFYQEILNKIDYYEEPFEWFDKIVESKIDLNGITIKYLLEDSGGQHEIVTLPWEYFENNFTYLENLRSKKKQDALILQHKNADKQLEQAKSFMQRAIDYKNSLDKI